MDEAYTKRLITVDAVMGKEAKKALEYFVELNPKMQGAQWPDALDMLYESDSHCDITEVAYEDLKAHLPVGSLEYVSLVTLTLIYANRGQAPYMATIAWWCGVIAGALDKEIIG